MKKLQILFSVVVFAVFAIAGFGCDDSSDKKDSQQAKQNEVSEAPQTTNSPIGKTFVYSAQNGTTVKISILQCSDNGGMYQGVAKIATHYASQGDVSGECDYIYSSGDNSIMLKGKNEDMLGDIFDYENKTDDRSCYYINISNNQIYNSQEDSNSNVNGIQLTQQ